MEESKEKESKALDEGDIKVLKSYVRAAMAARRVVASGRARAPSLPPSRPGAVAASSPAARRASAPTPPQ